MESRTSKNLRKTSPSQISSSSFSSSLSIELENKFRAVMVRDDGQEIDVIDDEPNSSRHKRKSDWMRRGGEDKDDRKTRRRSNSPIKNSSGKDTRRNVNKSRRSRSRSSSGSDNIERRREPRGAQHKRVRRSPESGNISESEKQRNEAYELYKKKKREK